MNFTPGMRVRVKPGFTLVASNLWDLPHGFKEIRAGECGRVELSSKKLYVQFTRERRLNIDARMLEGHDESLEVLP